MASLLRAALLIFFYETLFFCETHARFLFLSNRQWFAGVDIRVAELATLPEETCEWSPLPILIYQLSILAHVSISEFIQVRRGLLLGPLSSSGIMLFFCNTSYSFLFYGWDSFRYLIFDTRNVFPHWLDITAFFTFLLWWFISFIHIHIASEPEFKPQLADVGWAWVLTNFK